MNYCGIDLASAASAVCIVDEAGQMVAEFEVPTDEDGLRTRFSRWEPLDCVVEASPLAEWVAAFLEGLGHTVTVIDPRKAKGVICTKKKRRIGWMRESWRGWRRRSGTARCIERAKRLGGCGRC